MNKQIGYALAMRVLQSDLYAKLDDEERGECDALIRAGVGEPRQGGEPSGLEEMRGDMAVLLEDLIWCSGSQDFGPNGLAREGWLKVSSRFNAISRKWFPAPRTQASPPAEAPAEAAPNLRKVAARAVMEWEEDEEGRITIETYRKLKVISEAPESPVQGKEGPHG